MALGRRTQRKPPCRSSRGTRCGPRTSSCGPYVVRLPRTTRPISFPPPNRTAPYRTAPYRTVPHRNGHTPPQPTAVLGRWFGPLPLVVPEPLTPVLIPRTVSDRGLALLDTRSIARHPQYDVTASVNHGPTQLRHPPSKREPRSRPLPSRNSCELQQEFRSCATASPPSRASGGFLAVPKVTSGTIVSSEHDRSELLRD